jgi:serine/threonine-protein phosphatase 2A regulatory subunit B'
MLEESWPHIHLVYEILLRVIISPYITIKIVKEFLNQKFLRKLFELFKSPDPRERDYLKTINHRLYSKYMIYRSFIRKLMMTHLLECIYDSQSQYGIAEVLQLYSSLIVGFTTPLKEEHKEIYRKCLIHLHKS